MNFQYDNQDAAVKDCYILNVIDLESLVVRSCWVGLMLQRKNHGRSLSRYITLTTYLLLRTEHPLYGTAH